MLPQLWVKRKRLKDFKRFPFFFLRGLTGASKFVLCSFCLKKSWSSEFFSAFNKESKKRKSWEESFYIRRGFRYSGRHIQREIQPVFFLMKFLYLNTAIKCDFYFTSCSDTIWGKTVSHRKAHLVSLNIRICTYLWSSTEHRITGI